MTTWAKMGKTLGFVKKIPPSELNWSWRFLSFFRILLEFFLDFAWVLSFSELEFFHNVQKKALRKEIDRLDLYLFSSRVLWKNKSSFETADHAQKFKKYRDSFHYYSLLPNLSNALNKTNTVPKSQKLC